MESLKKLLPEDMCEWIVSIFPGIRGNGEDEILWNSLMEMDFSVKSAYNMLAVEDHPVEGSHWKFIWKWPGNQRSRTFMWLCAHNKILTNKQRVKRNFTMDPLCDFCRSSEETIIHVLSDCLVVQDLWKMLVKPRCWRDFFFWGEFMEWLMYNSRRELGKFDNLSWKLTFGEAIRRIWLNRNAWVFNRKQCDIANLYWSILVASKDFENNREVLNFSNLAYKEICVGWTPPYPGWLKCNVDGTSGMDGYATGCGELFVTLRVSGSGASAEAWRS